MRGPLKFIPQGRPYPHRTDKEPSWEDSPPSITQPRALSHPHPLCAQTRCPFGPLDLPPEPESPLLLPPPPPARSGPVSNQ